MRDSCHHCKAPGPIQTNEIDPNLPVCTSCKAPISPGEKYCRHCGETRGLPAQSPGEVPVPVCPSCGKDLKQGKKYLRDCGI
ncbi:MAG: zinc ribbon-containing protein [Burkholderiales bacterium]|uniref:zinc ribbon domain-containing protein n=1 Tax=Methanospirillum sp. TaxID=45200 RepID=UPI001BD34657|nr:zinc ribbon-containing protein [Burkholderiales bacterium]